MGRFPHTYKVVGSNSTPPKLNSNIQFEIKVDYLTVVGFFFTANKGSELTTIDYNGVKTRGDTVKE